MIALVSDADRLADRIQTATARTVESLKDGWVSQEPHFTDRLLARIEDAVNGFNGDGVHWRARTLTDHGPGSEEKRFGADFLGVFEATTTELSLSKGFLSQSKMLDIGDQLSSKEYNRLREQCRRMLDRTPDSFVFLYAAAGVRVVSANAVLHSAERSLDELGTKEVGEFFHDHFRCFIGDPSLTAPTDISRVVVVRDLVPTIWPVRRVLFIQAVGT
jgi:hypothetical protein